MKRLGIGLVGSGFMGRSHAHAFRAAPGVFDLPMTPVLELLADWHYQPSVFVGGVWRPLAGFDLEAHQRSSIGRVSQSFVRRVVWPRPRYVNLVLCRP